MLDVRPSVAVGTAPAEQRLMRVERLAVQLADWEIA
jgi:hypothetical protein